MQSLRNFENEINNNSLLERIMFYNIQLKNLNQMKYIKPVLTKNCKHSKECFELSEFQKKHDNNQSFRCHCGQIANQYSDLMWDIRYQANLEFHEFVDDIQIIQGLLVNKYQRNKKYVDLFTKPEIQEKFFTLITPSNQTSNFLTSLIDKNNIQQQELYAICLLDFVKIIIPIRILGCQHLECYELTSLLYYQQNNQKNETSFLCTFPNCRQKLDISNLDAFFNGIFIDQQLLKEIKKNNPISIIFNIKKQTKTFKQKTYFPLSQVLTVYSNNQGQEKMTLELEFQSKCDQVLSSIIQTNLLLEKPELKQSLSQRTLSLSKFNLVDKITTIPIELPTRCINCKDFNKSIDLLTYIFDFVYKKQINNKQKYSCPLCNSPQNQIMAIVNLNQYIYIDQFLLLKLLKRKNDEYEQKNDEYEQRNEKLFQHIQSEYHFRNEFLIGVRYDTFSILNLKKLRYTNPTLTKICSHRNSCFELQEAFQQIKNYKQIQCPHCQQNARSPNDLVQDWRVQAYQEFNGNVADVMVINGIMVNKYIRKNKYLNFFSKEEYSDQFLQMCQKANKDTSINYMIKKDLQQQNLARYNKINFWCFCLQDKVKINIPVRILGCKHYECYELTSILFYQEQNRKNQEYFECKQPGCSNRLRISHKNYSRQDQIPNSAEIEGQEKMLDIQLLFSQICLDLDLLNVIKKSHPSQLKFYYNQETETIQEDINTVGGKVVDPFICEFYEEHEDLQNKMTYQEFQNLTFQQILAVSQGNLLQEDRQLVKQIALQKYRNYQVKMQDQFTQLIIEYPVRCKFCTDFKVCMDLRSYIADFNYQKKMYPTKVYACPLCKKQQNVQMITAQIQNYIYLDPNIISYIFKNIPSIQEGQIFRYQGEQYLLQEFKDRWTIKREDYINSLQGNQIKFNQLFCIVNNDMRIKLPLILQNCPNKNIVNFESFYKELKKIKFDIENTGLILCKCNTCIKNPIMSIKGQIYFHEAFEDVFRNYYQSTNSFTYTFADIERDSFIVTKIQPQMKIENIMSNDYYSMIDDEKYQQIFSRRDIQGYQYQIHCIKLRHGQFIIEFTLYGIHLDLQSQIDLINKNISPELSFFSFKITEVVIEIESDQFFGFFSHNYRISSNRGVKKY